MTSSEYRTLTHWQAQYKKYGTRHCALWRMDDGHWVDTVDCFGLRDQGYLRQKDGPYNHTSFYLTDKAIDNLKRKESGEFMTDVLEHARARCREENQRFQERRNNAFTSMTNL